MQAFILKHIVFSAFLFNFFRYINPLQSFLRV